MFLSVDKEDSDQTARIRVRRYVFSRYISFILRSQSPSSAVKGREKTNIMWMATIKVFLRDIFELRISMPECLSVQHDQAYRLTNYEH